MTNKLQSNDQWDTYILNTSCWPIFQDYAHPEKQTFVHESKLLKTVATAQWKTSQWDSKTEIYVKS